MDNAHLSRLYAAAFHYISNVGSKLSLIQENWNYDDAIAQTEWYKPFLGKHDCIDVETDWYIALLQSKSIDDLPPKLKRFVIALEEQYKNVF